MTRSLSALAAGMFAAACLSHAASAQQVGTYTGTTTDGSNINFTVATDANTGKLQITSFGIGFSDSCSPGAFTFNSGWGLPGQSADLTGASTTYNFSFGYFDVTATIKFSGSNASGTVTNVTPTFVPVASGAPKKAALCRSAKQAYTASITAGSAVPASKPIQGFVYEGSTRR